MKRLNIIFLMLNLLQGLVFAQNYSWTHTGGPNGGIVGDMVINANGEIIAGVYGYISPTFEFKYYSGLYKSTDNGSNWKEIETQFDPFEIYALYINKAGHLLVGTNHQGRIYRSTDNGVTWENNNDGYNTGECWAFGESRDSILFAGNGEGEVYRSVNYGNSWEFSGNLMSLVFATDSNNSVYCGTHNGLYKSTDNGLTWAQNSSFNNMAVSSILIDNSNNIYIGTGYYGNGNGVQYSTDGGNSWTQIGLAEKIVLSLALDSNNNLYAGTKWDGLFKSTNSGQTWTQHQNGIEGIEVFRLKINSENNIFIGSENEGVYRSMDEGNTFTQVGLPISHIQNIDFSPDKNYIFASTPSGVQRYNRTTRTWENKGLKDIEAVSVSPSGDLYAATFPASLYYSSNLGNTWAQINIDTNIIEIYNFKAITDSILIIASYPKFSLSFNNGNTWNFAAFGGSPWNSSIAYDFKKGIYLNGGAIYYTSNLGLSFIQVAPPSSLSRKNGLTINSNDDLFYLSSQSNNELYGIYSSNIPYFTWTKIYNAIPFSIFIDPNNKIYSSLKEGISFSSDNGNNWESIFIVNQSRAIAHDLKVDDNILFIATNSYGLYELQIPTSVEEADNLFIDNHLFQNYPNPFNPTTTINYSIAEAGVVTIKVYDILGKEVITLVNEQKGAGVYTVNFNAANLPSGVYLYRIHAGSFISSRKLLLVK